MRWSTDCSQHCRQVGTQTTGFATLAYLRRLGCRSCKSLWIWHRRPLWSHRQIILDKLSTLFWFGRLPYRKCRHSSEGLRIAYQTALSKCGYSHLRTCCLQEWTCEVLLSLQHRCKHRPLAAQQTSRQYWSGIWPCVPQLIEVCANIFGLKCCILIVSTASLDCSTSMAHHSSSYHSPQTTQLGSLALLSPWIFPWMRGARCAQRTIQG